MASKVRTLNIMSVIVIASFMAFDGAYMFYMCYGTFVDYYDWEANTLNVLSWFTAISFLILGIVFLWASLAMIKALKANFSDFYETYSRMIWTATLVLTIPLPLRTIFDILKLWDKFEEVAGKGDGSIAVYNFCIFLSTTYLPIIF